jgi:hypothetical protein
MGVRGRSGGRIQHRMADRLLVDEERMRNALRGQELQKALVICERIAASLRSRIAESPTAKNGARARANGQEPPGRVRLSKIAHRLGIDPRTLRKHIEQEDFVEHPVARVWLVHEARFDRYYAARGRKF